MEYLIPAVIIVALVLLNGLFVSAEFAIVGVPGSELERSVLRGSRVAAYVRDVVRDPRRQDRFIATAQLGITAASLGLGMYGEHVLAGWLAGLLEGLGTQRWIAAHSVASVLSVAVLTYLHIVVGEMVPKSLALQRPHATVLSIAPIMRAMQFGVYPFVLLLNGIGNGLLRLAGIDRAAGGTEQFRTPEELAYVVRESQAGGLLRKEAAHVVNELLEFGSLTAGEVMLPRVRILGLPAGADAAAIREVLLAAPHSRYPVYEGDLDRVVGVLHVKDVMRVLVAGYRVTTKDVRPVPFVPEAASVDDVLTAMRQTPSQIAIVMDEHGGTAGMLTLEDLFEEVVGEIDDVRDHRPSIHRDAEGRLHVDGTVRLEDAGAALGVVLEHAEVDTVSGVVLTLLGRPPRVGDVVLHEEARFEVTAVRGRGVAECIVSLADSGPAAPAA